MESRSPFYVIEEFVSPLMCEDIIDACNFNVPDKDKEGKHVKTTRTSETSEQILFERLQLALPEIQSYYQFTYRGTERMQFEWFPEESKGHPQAENSEYLRGKWLRTRARDISGVLFLSDYQETTPFETEYDVYGGKLEFPQHRFGFNPTRGTLVLFPSDPHFINITSPVFAGDLYQVRIQIAATTPLLYDPATYPGNYTDWFKPLLS